MGGRWVYAIKNNIDGSEKCKARYVAKGYSQKRGVDYEETFSPTANLTSIRVIIQKAVQENLILHHMDVKTAYLNAPIDQEIYIEQPEGYEVKSGTNAKLVCRLERSLYGLKLCGSAVPVWLSGRALRLLRKRLWVRFPGNTCTNEKCIT